MRLKIANRIKNKLMEYLASNMDTIVLVLISALGLMMVGFFIGVDVEKRAEYQRRVKYQQDILKHSDSTTITANRT